MQALRIAKAFGQHDVDAFLDDITHEQYLEWCAFFQFEPTGWEAIRIAAVRICYWIAQVRSKKQLKEKSFDIVMGANVLSPEAEHARWEAAAVRSEIIEEIHGQED